MKILRLFFLLSLILGCKKPKDTIKPISNKIFGINFNKFDLERFKNDILRNSGDIHQCPYINTMDFKCLRSFSLKSNNLPKNNLILVEYSTLGHIDYSIKEGNDFINKVTFYYDKKEYNNLKTLIVNTYGNQYTSNKISNAQIISWHSPKYENKYYNIFLKTNCIPDILYRGSHSICLKIIEHLHKPNPHPENIPNRTSVPKVMFGIDMSNFNLQDFKKIILKSNGKYFPCGNSERISDTCFRSKYFIGKNLNLNDLVYIQYSQADLDFRINEIKLIFKRTRYDDIKTLLFNLYGNNNNVIKVDNGKTFEWLSEWQNYKEFAIFFSDYAEGLLKDNNFINKEFTTITLNYFDYHYHHGKLR